jgi:uroporphyrinogen III methyltransferase / synthase
VTSMSESALREKIVVVTRAAAQSGELCEELNARGARVRLLPLVSFVPPENYDALDGALTGIETFDWVLFTSVNAVQALERRGNELHRGLNRDVKLPRAATVGPVTADAAEAAGFSVEYVAADHSGAGLARELGEELRNKKVFLPRSDRANADLPAALRRSGALVTEVVAYRNLPPSTTDREKLHESLRDGVDSILFYSPSAVQNFLELLGSERLGTLQGRVLMLAIGPTTANALSAAGIQRIARAADTTTKAIVEVLEGHLARTKKRSAVGVKEE